MLALPWKGRERKQQYREIAYLMLRSRTPFLRVEVLKNLTPTLIAAVMPLKSSEKYTLSRNIPYWIESVSGLSDCALGCPIARTGKAVKDAQACILSLTAFSGFAI